MRELKFRAVASVNDKYNGIKAGDMVFGAFVETNIDCQILWGDGDQIAVDRKTVSQFTGITNKNGVEIYESDIYYDGFENVVIEYCNDTASYVAYDGVERHPLGEHTKREVIIGNIHQNSELLELSK